MKKHAKKSLLIPILALCSVLAVCACIYLSQAFSAYADGESDAENLELSATSVVYGNIHLSNGDIFRGVIDEDGETEDFIAWSGEKHLTYKDVTGFDFTVAPNMDRSNYTDINVYAYGPSMTENPICRVTLCNDFYTFTGGSYNFTWADNTVDISLGVTPSYYIWFNANGGLFSHDTSIQAVVQGEYNYLNLPKVQPIYNDHSALKTFAGWYTHPIWGERVTGDTRVSDLVGTHVLYAHWATVTEKMTINFSTADFGQMFYYELYRAPFSDDEDFSLDSAAEGGGVVESGNALNYIVPSEYSPYPGVGNARCNWGTHAKRPVENTIRVRGENIFFVTWNDAKYVDNGFVEPEYAYSLAIYPLENQRLESVSLNGGDINIYSRVGSREPASEIRLSQYNNFVVSTAWSMPGFINVVSDNGGMFKCMTRSTSPEKKEFVTDYLPIFVDADEYVYIIYGGYYYDEYYHLSGDDLLGDTNESYPQGVEFAIRIINYKTFTQRYYYFTDNTFSSFDWLGLNSYILGVNVDENEIPVSSYWEYLPNGYHSIEFNMTNQPADTTVTYNANGGKFADDSDTVTLDATYGEALPVAENPRAIGMDFVGWFTAPEGGVQVDPASYHWMPWDRWAGVTLYAHWAEAPVPPVPPEPGPTPEPVNPDVPGGGGSAQTGDSMPLVPIAVIAIVAALGCGLAIRKEYF